MKHELPAILLASRNRKKLAELAGQLEPFGFRLLAAADVEGAPDAWISEIGEG